MAHAIYMLYTYGYGRTLRICNTLLFHGNNGYVIRTLSVLLGRRFVWGKSDADQRELILICETRNVTMKRDVLRYVT